MIRDNYRNTGLVPPLDAGDGAVRQPSTAEVIASEIASESPIEGAKRDAAVFLREMAPEDVVTIIMVRNTGLDRATATQIVSELAGRDVQSTFKVVGAVQSLGDAPETKKEDPRLARILAARADAQRYLSEDFTLDQIQQAIRLRNNISEADARQIISDLTREPQE